MLSRKLKDRPFNNIKPSGRRPYGLRVNTVHASYFKMYYKTQLNFITTQSVLQFYHPIHYKQP